MRQRFERPANALPIRQRQSCAPDLAEATMQFQFLGIHPKAASEIDSQEDTSDLLGQTKQAMTKRVYRRVGKVVNPMK
ncbi:hypothetical protein NG726_22660 [Pseudomonas sp. MOB-449]|nr:hypothetical protein [Pseudomonas sp. MOB-449]